MATSLISRGKDDLALPPKTFHQGTREASLAAKDLPLDATNQVDTLGVYKSAQNSKSTGSVFINNSSYSGADIKVVVNLYGETDEDQLDEINTQQTDIQLQLNDINSKLAEAKTGLDGSHSGTKEASNYTTLHANLNNEKIRLEDQLQILSQSLDTINKQVKEGIGNSGATKVLAEVQTLSLSVFRDKRAVRSLGSVYPKGVVRGPREIAGSLIFTVFNEHVMYELLRVHPSDFDACYSNSTAILDQLPPVDILISFANEYGQISRMSIYGVEFMTEGQTHSIEDLITENAVNFIARDFDPMRSIGARKIDRTSFQLQRDMGKRASDLLYEEDYQNFTNSIDPYSRFKNRRDPFV